MTDDASVSRRLDHADRPDGLRFGAGYNFALGERFTLLPALNLDPAREEGHWVEALVFTVTLGFEF